VKKRHQVLRREHKQMAAALQTIERGTLLAEQLKTQLGHEKMVLEQKREVQKRDCSQPSIVSCFYSFVEHADRIARELDASAVCWTVQSRDDNDDNTTLFSERSQTTLEKVKG